MCHLICSHSAKSIQIIPNLKIEMILESTMSSIGEKGASKIGTLAY